MPLSRFELFWFVVINRLNVFHFTLILLVAYRDCEVSPVLAWRSQIAPLLPKNGLGGCWPFHTSSAPCFSMSFIATHLVRGTCWTGVHVDLEFYFVWLGFESGVGFQKSGPSGLLSYPKGVAPGPEYFRRSSEEASEKMILKILWNIEESLFQINSLWKCWCISEDYSAVLYKLFFRTVPLPPRE